MVAKTFQNMPQMCEPFESGGKMYVNVQTKSGSLRRVRWYEVDEYIKMYPDTNRADIDEYYKSLKRTLCGDGGYVWVLEGHFKDNLDVFEMNPNIRYNISFGWYVRSDADEYVIEALKEFCVPHKLYWEQISVDENTLLPKDEVVKIVNKVCNGRTTYEWQ